MARGARVRNLVLVGHRGRYEAERVCSNVHAGDSRFNLRHVAGHTLAAGTSGLVMSVFFESRGSGSVERQRTVAVQTDLVGGLAKLCVVIRPMYVVAIEAGHPAAVHDALHEVVALHPVLVRGVVGKMGEGSFAESVLFQLPEL